jgi:purine-nucleoside phosphorylase
MSETLDFLRSRITHKPRVLLVLGSGLGALADQVSDAVAIPFADVPGFAPAHVIGHQGRLVAGTLEGVPVIALQGRYHMYEGHSAQAVALPVRTAAALGAEIMIVTNAAGGLNRNFRPGDLMLIDDHINMTGQNPLIGPVLPREQRFPDMSQPYDRALQEIAEHVALECKQRLVRGVYLAVLGPSYETPAEIRMYERFGADAIGMSTVPEVITARALGLRVLGISLISNVAAGMSGEPLTHDEVIEAGIQASAAFAGLVRGILAQI